MARSKQTSQKREKEKKKQKKRLEKEARREERLTHSKKGLGLDTLVDRSFEHTIAKQMAVASTPTPIVAKENTPSQGRVSYYNEQKGYGFIKDQVTKGTVFFETASLPSVVKVNDVLMYTVVKGPKGATADQILKVA